MQSSGSLCSITHCPDSESSSGQLCPSPGHAVCDYGFSCTHKQALEISPAIFAERICTAVEYDALLQLEILAEKQVGGSALSFQT